MSKFSLWYLSNQSTVKKAILTLGATLLCIVLVFAVVRLSSRPLTEESTVDWTMQAYLVAANGDIAQTKEIFIAGKIEDKADGRDSLWLDITLPDSFQHSVKFADGSESYNRDRNGQFPYYICQGEIFDQRSNSFIDVYYAIDTQHETFICQWENLPGQYLIACRDGEVDPAVILAHFQGFIDHFSFAH